MSVDAALLARLQHVLRQGPALELAVLFGSATRARLHAGSDLDIAVLPCDLELPLRAELDLQAALADAAARPVDLLRLDRAPTLVKWQVAKHGQPLLEGSPHAFARFVAQASAEWIDFAPLYHLAGERFRRRLAEGRETPG